MTAKKNIAIAAPAPIASAEAAWLAAKASTAAAREAMQGVNTRPDAPREQRIKFLDGKASELEASDAEAAAALVFARELEGEATDSVEALELEACRPAAVRADLVALLAAEQAAKAEHEAARARTAERKAEAYAANEALSARRRSQGLPPPPALPRAATTWAGVDDSAETFIEGLDRAAVAAPGVNGEAIRTMRSEENRLRVEAERERIADERKEAKQLEIRKQNEQDYADRCAASVARNRAIDVDNAKDRADELALAAAHKARTAR